MQQTLIQLQEQAVEAILGTPEQGKRAAKYGMTVLNRRPRTVAAIRRRFETGVAKIGFVDAKVVRDLWEDVKDMAKLEAGVE
jgi:hypothetical protein